MTKTVLVLGMQRSGTSLATRILGDLGAYIENDHLAPDSMNERGYWESKELYEINIESLKAAGFDEYAPPPLFSGWEHAAVMRQYRDRARKFVERMGEHDVWAAKHPSIAISLPVLEPCLPRDTRFLVCVRNPLSVAKSNERWGHTRYTAGMLWMAYTISALVHTSRKKRLVLFYEDFAGDSDRQIRRIKDFTELEGVVTNTYDSSMAHQRADEIELMRSSSRPMGAKLLYRSLLESKSDPTVIGRLEADITRAGATGAVSLWSSEEFGNITTHQDLKARYDKLRKSKFVKLGRRIGLVGS